MSLTEMLAVVRRRWAWVVGGLLAGLLLASLAYVIAPKTYEAQATLYVAATDAENAAALSQGAAYVQSQMRSYPVLVTSPDVLRAVASDTGQDPGSLAGHVRTEVPTDSALLSITASADEPRRAAITADSFARRTAQQIQRIETRPGAEPPIRITTVSPPSEPSAPVSPKLLVFLALGLVGGTMASFVAAAVRDRVTRS